MKPCFTYKMDDCLVELDARFRAADDFKHEQWLEMAKELQSDHGLEHEEMLLVVENSCCSRYGHLLTQ